MRLLTQKSAEYINICQHYAGNEIHLQYTPEKNKVKRNRPHCYFTKLIHYSLSKISKGRAWCRILYKLM